MLSTVFTVTQLAFAAYVLLRIARLIRRIALETTSIEPDAYRDVVERALRSGDLARLAHASELGTPAWLATLPAAAVAAKRAGGDVTGDVGQALADVRDEASNTLRSLRILGRIGSATGLLGACIEMLWLLFGHHGLDALVPGRAEALAQGHALRALAIGFAIALIAWVTRGQLSKIIRAHLATARSLAMTLDDALGALTDMSESNEAG